MNAHVCQFPEMISADGALSSLSRWKSAPWGVNANFENSTDFTKNHDLRNSQNIRVIRIPLILVVMEDGLGP